MFRTHQDSPFVKTLFKLPKNTANYTDSQKQTLYTLKLYVNYILKVIKMYDKRLPKLIVNTILFPKMLQYREWEYLCFQSQVPLFQIEKPATWTDNLAQLLQRISLEKRRNAISKARHAQHYIVHPKLEFGKCNYSYSNKF